jgi:VCBS repeat-containing protein
VTVTITGTNDGPNSSPSVVANLTTASGQVTEDMSVNGSNEIAANGTVAFQDIDLIDTHTASFVNLSSHAAAALPGFIDDTTYIGTFELAPVSEDNADTNDIGSVGWTFTLDNSDPILQSLAFNESITQIYRVTVWDTHGGHTYQDVTVTIAGTNDAPVVVAGSTTATGGVTEDVGVSGGNIAASGAIGFQDVDLIDAHTASFVAKSSTSSAHLPGFGDNSTYIGTFALNPVSESNADTINTASVGWTFTLDDSNSVLQSLAAGQTITQIYTVKVDDGHGGAVTQDVTVTITGTNDAPIIVAGSTAASGAVTEDVGVSGSNIAASGAIGFQDVDLTDAHAASFVVKSSTSTAMLPGFTDDDTYIGTFALNPVSENSGDTTDTGSVGWTFTLDNSDSVLQSLAFGETITQVYTVKLDDGHGGIVTQDVTVTITGTNDAPTIVAGSTAATGGVTEDAGVSGGNIATSGTIGFSDPDLIDVHSTNIAQLSSHASLLLDGFADNVTFLGDFTVDPVSEDSGDLDATASVNWSFALENDNPLLQSLPLNQTITQVYRLSISDGHGGSVYQDVTVTITGTNDIPTVSAALTDEVAEGSASFAKNLLSGASDLDDGETATLGVTDVTYSVDGGVSSSTAPAGVSLSGHTLSVDPTDPAFDHLAVGSSTTIVVSYNVTDAQGATVPQTETVTITGTNDTPTVSAALTDEADEGSAAFSRNLLEGAADADDGATLYVGNLSFTVDGGSASTVPPAGVSLSGNMLSIDPTDPAFGHLTVNQHTIIEVVYDIVDEHGAAVHQIETVTINGVDSPSGSAPVVDLNGSGEAGVNVTVSIAPDNLSHDLFDIQTTLVSAAGGTIDHGYITVDGAVGATLGFEGIEFGPYLPYRGITITFSLDVGPSHLPGYELSGTADAADYAELFTHFHYSSWYPQSATITMVVSDGIADSAPATATVNVEPPASWDVFTGDGDGSSWIDDQNWSLGHAPGVPDYAYIATGTGVDLDLEEDLVEVHQLHLSNDTQLNLTGDGGVLRVDDAFINLGQNGVSVASADLELPGYVLNVGSIDAEGGSDIFFGGPAGSIVDNYLGGIISAVDGGYVLFTNVFLNGGEIDSIGQDSLVEFNGTTVAHATLHGESGGIFRTRPDTGTTVIFDGSGGVYARVAIEAGTDVIVSPNTTLEMLGEIHNAGNVTLAGNAAGAAVMQIDGDVTLTGHGNLNLLNPTYAVVISQNATPATLELAGQTVTGTGHLGGGALNLINDAGSVIDANIDIAGDRLWIETGAGTFTNHGLVVSSGAGGLDVAGDVMNDGTLQANAGLLEVHGAVTGHGHANIGGGIMRFDAASDADVVFNSPAVGRLVLGAVANFTGSVGGFSDGDAIDLDGIDQADVSLIDNAGVLELHYGQLAGQFISLGYFTTSNAPANFHLSSDGSGGTLVTFDAGPLIDTTHFLVTHNVAGTETVSGLEIVGSESMGPFTLTAYAAAPGSSITPPTDSGSLNHINSDLLTGVTYDPGSLPPQIDMITMTVTDNFGAGDTVHFVFNEAGDAPNLALTGTSGKDVIFGNGYDSILTGLGGTDQFVFTPTTDPQAPSHDTIADFALGEDRIDLRAFAEVDSGNIETWLGTHTGQNPANSADALITLDTGDTITLTNVNASTLHANSFIVSQQFVI